MPYYSSPKYKPEQSKASVPIIIIVFFVGIIALGFEMDLFRLTFISLPCALVIWTAFALGPFVLFIRLFKKRASGVKSYLVAVIYAFGSAGVPLYIFMAMNYYLADSKSAKQTYIVSSTYNGSPYNAHAEAVIEIQHKGLNKQIFYPRGTHVDNYKFITLHISKGYWAFDIINDKTIPPGKSSITI